MTLRVGLLVNPIAGVGGRAGLKGSDRTWRDALTQGYSPHAGGRAKRFVSQVTTYDGDVEWITCPGAMGVSGLPRLEGPAKGIGETLASDTTRMVGQLIGHGVDLLCFVGGDGTAADVAAAIAALPEAQRVPCLGIPGGVKITSPVFAHDPDQAAWLVANLDDEFDVIDRDVTDLDEDAYRDGSVQVVLKGSLSVPASPAVQGGKVPSGADTPLEPLVEQVMRDWEPDALHLVGAGSVCMAIKKQFWGEPTLLGVDAIHAGRIVATDLDSRQIEALLEKHDEVHLWLSIIGGQGMLLGRGTQVLTPWTLRHIGWEHLHVVAPPEKLMGLRGLHIDSGDPRFDEEAPRHIRVIAGWNEWRLLRLLHGAE